MNIDTALEKIYSLKQFHIKLGLDNIQKLLDYLGNPHNNLKAIHVAGSNGKGSTCSFLASILQEHGYKTGLYTSPHFVRFNERIRINGIEIADKDIIEFLETHKKYIDRERPTFFEITTALAFDYFSRNSVDMAVVETGLGGRLDATNLLDPLASIITSISIEHSHILGDSLAQIAAEKGGIIKKNKPVFIGFLPLEAENEIKIIAERNQSEFNRLTDYTDINDLKSLIKIEGVRIIIEKTGLNGNYQLKNASLAVLTLAQILKDELNFDSTLKGIENVVENTGIQGRYERYGNSENIIFDAAHNLEGIDIFLNEFKNEYNNYSERTLLFGAMKDKDIAKMLNKLNPFFDKIFITSSNYERSASPQEIKEIAEKNNIKCSIVKNPENLIEKHILGPPDNSLVVLGSIYLLGEIKKKIIQ